MPEFSDVSRLGLASPTQPAARVAETSPLPGRIFRALFHKTRPRGYMRIGQWMARVFPSMQDERVPFDEELFVSLDLRKIDHQPIFLDGQVKGDQEERTLLARIIPLGGTVIDVGANLGIYTLTLARLVGPQGLVISYEPEADALLKNTRALSQVVVRPFIVADRETQLRFKRERSTALSRIANDREESASDISLSSVTLDADCARLGLSDVAFIKIDVEGAEERVLNGARNLLTSSSPPILFFEWIPGFRARWQEGAFALLKRIVGGDWRFFRVGFDQPAKEIIGLNEPAEDANVIGFPPTRELELIRFLSN
jgi:FkbM family methyltransferase